MSGSSELSAIVAHLAGMGCVVETFSPLPGVKGLIVGRMGMNYLFLLVPETMMRVDRGLEKWIKQWRGQVQVVSTVEEMQNAMLVFDTSYLTC